MAEFVRAQIFGTTFEITSRYELSIPPSDATILMSTLGTPTYNLLAWVPLVLSGIFPFSQHHRCFIDPLVQFR